MTGKSFPDLAAVEDTRPTLERLKAFFFAFGRLALAERMNAAQAEIERGKERLWLGAADGEAATQMERTSAMLQVNHPSLIAKDFNQPATLSPRLGKHGAVYVGLALLLLGLGAVAASVLLETDAKRTLDFGISAPTP